MIKVSSITKGPQHLYNDTQYTHYGVDVMINHPDGYVVSGGGDYHAKIWHPDTLQVIRNFHANTHHDITAIAVSHSGKYVATGHGSAGGVHLWDVESDKLVWHYERLMYIKAIAFDESDATVTALNGPDSRYMFDARTGDRLFQSDGDGSCESLAMQRNGKLFFVAKRQTLTAHQTSTGKLIWRISDFTDGEQIEEIRLLPDEEHMAVIFGENRIALVRNADGALGQRLILAVEDQSWNHEFPLAVTPDLGIMAIATDSGRLLFYRTTDGSYLASHQMDEKLDIKSLLFSHDGTKLIVGDGAYDRGETFVLRVERLGAATVSPFDGIEWKRPLFSAFDKFILDNNLNIVSGYYHNDAFITDIKSMEPDRLSSMVDLIRESAAGSGGNFVNILKKIFDRAKKCDAHSLAAEVAILMLRYGLPSAGAVIHDAWGMMAYCAEEGCKYLLTYPLDTLSDAARSMLSRNLTMAIAVNDELDDIGISGLNELKRLLISHGIKETT